MTGAQEWMPAYQAVAELKPILRGGVAAKKELADQLKDGNIRARAEQKWVTETGSVDRAWKAGSDVDADAEFDVDLPKNVWRSSRRWNVDQGLWRWPKNNFHITRRREPRKYIMLQGVSFAVADIEAIKQALTQDPQQKRSRAGRKVKWLGWAKLTRAVVRLDRANELKAGKFPTVKKLRERLLSESDEGVSDTALRDYASYVYEKLLREDDD